MLGGFGVVTRAVPAAAAVRWRRETKPPSTKSSVDRVNVLQGNAQTWGPTYVALPGISDVPDGPTRYFRIYAL